MGREMDKSWMQHGDGDRFGKKYSDGVKQFMSMACRHTDRTNRIRCPCRKCNNVYIITPEEVEDHLFEHGIVTSYTKWVHHGEPYDPIIEDDDDDDFLVDNEEEYGADIQELLEDVHACYRHILKKSKINKENRAKLKVSHIMGTKSFVRARYDERNRETEEEPDRIAFWKMTHHSNEKGWCDPTAEAIYGEMIELKATSEMEGTMMTVDEICDQVLGTRPGYIRGLGHGPKPTSGRRSNLEAIEEAKKRAEMAEKRAEELAERLESQHLEKDAQMDAMTTRQSHLETMLQSILEQMQSLGHRPTFP